MSRKPGRNDPCPCGSGEKYKRCCLRASAITSTDPRMMNWKRLRRLLDQQNRAIFEFTLRVYGDDALHDAWSEFVADETARFDPDAMHLELFFAWMQHWWTPEPDDDYEYPEELVDIEPTRLWLDRHGAQAHQLLRQYLERCLEAHFSFYEVISTDPGVGLTVVDLLTDDHHEVFEAAVSRSATPGLILFGALVEIEGMTLIEGIGNTGLERGVKLAIIEQRDLYQSRGIKLTREGLREHADDLAYFYLCLADIVDDIPSMYNSDEELLVPQRLCFDLDDPEAALAALAHLDADASPEDIERRVERDPEGRFERARLDWKRPGNAQSAALGNTVLGQLVIEDGELIAEVNSDERADRLRELIDSALGGAVQFQSSERESMEAVLSEMQAGSADAAGRFPDMDDALLEDPEIQAQVQELLELHYENWPDEPLIALDDQTPLEAVKTKAGKAKVAALLDDFEETIGAVQPSQDPELFRRLRKRLGLN